MHSCADTSQVVATIGCDHRAWSIPLIAIDTILAVQTRARWSLGAAIPPLILLGTQIVSLSPLIQAVYYTYGLPAHVDVNFDIYQDVENAAARILLPAKGTAFPVLDTDAAFASEAELSVAQELPYCGGRDDGPLEYTPTQLPEWLLPMDESGLANFANALVRRTATELV